MEHINPMVLDVPGLMHSHAKGLKEWRMTSGVKRLTPDHDVTLPFTRMVAGPMDYTPGAMINMDKVNFTPNFTRPESQGTRAHQVALYVIYESPLQMLSDSPSNYMKEQETTDFIVKIPVVWDDIIGIDGKVGDYLFLARRSGKEWFVGALTDWTAAIWSLISHSFLLGIIPWIYFRMALMPTGMQVIINM